MLPEENVVQDDDFTEVEVTQKEEETKESTDVSSSKSSAEPAEKEEELEQYSTKVQKRIDKVNSAFGQRTVGCGPRVGTEWQ